MTTAATPEVLLKRSGRTVLAAGPAGGPLTPRARAWLEEALTYLERRYDHAAVDGQARFELTERKLYAAHPAGLLFPLGLKPRVLNGLTRSGIPAAYLGSPLAAESPRAHAADWDGMLAEFNPHPDQLDALVRVDASDGGILAATTGAGKSYLMRTICRLYPSAKIHVVTRGASLVDEIYTDLSAVLPDVGRVGGGKRDPRRVTVFTADSLHHGMGDSDLLLGDEVHELAAPKYSAVLGRYTRARMFGFSATPKGRADGRDLVAEAVFGPVIHTLSYQEAEALGRVVPITVEWLRFASSDPTAGKRLPAAKERAGVWRHAARNRAVAERVRLFGPDEQVLVMVKTIDHAAHLKALLPEFTLCYASGGLSEERLSAYVRQGLLPADEPEMTPRRLGELRRAFAAGELKKVIANYVWSTGVNFRHLGVLVRADAAASAIRDGQIPGRICRRVPGAKESALLVDVWDDWSPTYLNRSRSRRRNYQSRGWSQVYSDAAVGGR